MFTMKLYRRSNPASMAITSFTIGVHKVIAHEIGERWPDGKFRALELHAYKSDQNNDYDTYYVGETSPGMEAHGRNDLHLESGPHSWWGWGLLENWEGNTSEHYRPASYG